MYGIKKNVKKIKIKKRLSKLLNFKDTTSTIYVVVKKEKRKTNKNINKVGKTVLLQLAATRAAPLCTYSSLYR